MKKGQIYEGTIESVDFPNKGNIYLDGEKQHVVVKNGIPGQKVRFAVRKCKRGSAQGSLLEVLEKSPLSRSAASFRLAEGACTRPCPMRPSLR